jgi:hypothetical protein
VSEQVARYGPPELSAKALTVGVFALGEAYAVAVSKRTFQVFLTALTGHMSDNEFAAVVRRAIETEERWCSPAVLLRIMRQLREERVAEGPTEDEMRAAEDAADRNAEVRA